MHPSMAAPPPMRKLRHAGASGSIAHMALPDLHMHTPRCNHATGAPRDYAEAALAAGLPEIGFSEHAPMPNGFDAAWRMSEAEVGDYFAEIRELAARYRGRLVVRIGIECDFRPGDEPFLRELLAAHPWDYALGSVHFIGDWGFDNPDEIAGWETRDVEEVHLAYYDLVARAAASGLFDVLAHPDLVKKFGHRCDTPRVREAERRMLEAAARAGVALEISSAGLRKPVGEVYPAKRLVAAAADMGMAFAFGSDAHAPGEVGHAWRTCRDLLRAAGVRAVRSFARRRPVDHPIA